MTNDWKPGDLALCINDAPADFTIAPGYFENEGFTVLRRGAVYQVARVHRPMLARHLIALGFVEDSNPWVSARFIKVTPEQADEFDAEIIRAMTGKPVRAPKEGTVA